MRRLQLVILLFMYAGSLITCILPPDGTGECLFDDEFLNFTVPPAKYFGYKIWQADTAEDAFIGYNYPDHALDIYSLTDGQYKGEIKFRQDGPNTINQVLSFFVYSRDSIFILSDRYIYIIDSSAGIQQKILINNANSTLKGIDFSRNTIYCTPDHNAPVFFNPSDRRLYCAVKPVSNATSLDYFDSKIAGFFDFNDTSFQFLDMRYPGYMKERFYGMMDKPNIIFQPDMVFYNFKPTHHLYQYDISSGAIQVRDFRSKLNPGEADPIDGNVTFTGDSDLNLISDHFKNNPVFFKLRLNPFNNEIYLVHLGPSMIDEEGTIRRMSFISIFDISSRAGQRAQEFRIPYSHTTRILFPLRNGVGLIQDQEVTDDRLPVQILQCDG